MELQTLKNVNNYLNINIDSYLETSGGQMTNLLLNVVHSTPVLIKHLWQFKTVVFLHWCLIRSVLLGLNIADTFKSSSILIYENTSPSIYTQS
jgi:hypothetical protein